MRTIVFCLRSDEDRLEIGGVRLEAADNELLASIEFDLHRPEKERQSAFSLLVERNSRLAMEGASELGSEAGAVLLADRSVEEIAARIPPSSHTNPIFAIVGGKPIRASRRSAE